MARVGPQLEVSVLRVPPGRGRPRAGTDVRPLLKGVEVTPVALLAAATTGRPLGLLKVVVAAVTGSTALAATRIVYADHARLERAEKGLEVWHARKDNTEALHKHSADDSWPGREGPVRGTSHLPPEDELRDDGSDDEDAEGKDENNAGFFYFQDPHALHDHGRDDKEEHLSDDVEDPEANPKCSLFPAVSLYVQVVQRFLMGRGADLVDTIARYNCPPLRRRTLECYSEKSRHRPQTKQARESIRQKVVISHGRKRHEKHEGRGLGKEQGRDVKELRGINTLPEVSPSCKPDALQHAQNNRPFQI